jgi:hypothetical protein
MCCYPFLGSHKNEKIQKKIYQKKSKNNRSKKRIARMPKKMPKSVEEIQKCKRLKFDSERPVDEENSI